MIQFDLIRAADPILAEMMEGELRRQRDHLELIASENFVSEAVMAAMGSHLTNKYAEGYPGKRYYGGCEMVDKVEDLARDRLKELFGAEHANVQPHSGAQANLAVYFSLLNYGDTVMGMDLSHGGHLTHGSPVNMSGKYFKIVPYGVSKETEQIDYDKMREIALECKPRMIVAGASAYSRAINFERICEIAHEVGAYFMVDMVEDLARDRLKELFGAEHANVQPHSGAQANLAVYFSLLNYGDTVMGMDLSHGGHLTHGSPVNMSGKYFKIVPYGVSKETEQIDYDKMREIALECKPRMIVAGASAYSRAINFERICEIAHEVGAYFMVDMAHIAGLVAAGEHMNPVPYADVVTSTTHKTLRGPRGGLILCKAEHAKAIDKGVFPGTQGGPLMHIIAAKAVCFHEALQPSFKEYQKQVVKNAAALAQALQANGMRIVSGGTDNHLMLVDLTSTGRTGKEVEALLDRANITVNKNTIPFETRSPFVTSGIRIGTPAVTSRGFNESDMLLIASFIARIVEGGEEAVEEVKKGVLALCEQHPLY